MRGVVSLRAYAGLLTVSLVLSTFVMAGLLVGPIGAPDFEAKDGPLSSAEDGALSAALASGPESDPATKIDPRLEEAITAAGPHGSVRAFVVLEDQPVPEEAPRGPLRAEAIAAHKAQVKVAQAPLVAVLDVLRAQDLVHSYDTYWLANAVLVDATPAALHELAGLPFVAALLEEGEVTVSDVQIDVTTLGENKSMPRTTFTEMDVDAVLGSNNIELPERSELMVDPSDVPVPEVSLMNQTVNITAVPDTGSAPGGDPTLAWGVKRVHAVGALDQGIDGEGILVAVLDTGIEADHPDLDGRVTHWKDFVSSPSAAHDVQGHGTHVAGTIAGTGASGFRTGVAPGASLMGVKVLDDSGSGLMGTIFAGVEYAVENGADVISMSLGSSTRMGIAPLVMDNAGALGSVVVVAAGNGGSDSPFSLNIQNLLMVGEPGRVESVITVGATNYADRIAGFSSHQDFGSYAKPDLVAPGVDVSSAYPAAKLAGDHVALDGTSMATPHVAGIAALVLQEDPTLSPADVKALLMSTARDLGAPGFDLPYGAGLVDASAAWVARHGGSPPVLSETITVEEVAGDVITTITLNLTNSDGIAIAGEQITAVITMASPELLALGKSSDVLTHDVQTALSDGSGHAVFIFTNLHDVDHPSVGNLTSRFSLDAYAHGGLTRTIAPIDHAQVLDVSTTFEGPFVKFNGDNITVTIETLVDIDPPGVIAPGDLPVTMDSLDVCVVGPTLGGSPLTLCDSVSGTALEGSETFTFQIPPDLVDMSGLFGGPGFGSWDLIVQPFYTVGTETWAQIYYESNIHEVRPHWTSLDFNRPGMGLLGLQDIGEWQGRVAPGQTDVPFTIESTLPTTEFHLFLIRIGLDLTAPAAVVTTDENGFAQSTVDVPVDLIAGTGVSLLLTKELVDELIGGASLNDFSGDWNLHFFSVQTVATDISFESLAGGESLIPGETVRVTIRTRNATTFEPVDPASLSLSVGGFSSFDTPVQTSTGVFEANAVLIDALSLPSIKITGVDADGSGFIASDYALASDYTTVITPGKTHYEPGEDAKMVVTVSKTRTGEPVAFADVLVCAQGSNSDGSLWSSDDNNCAGDTIVTDEFGQAMYSFKIPADAVEIKQLGIDVIGIAVPMKSGQNGVALTGFKLFPATDGVPRLAVNPVGAQETGYLGLLGVPYMKPGQTQTFEVVAKNFDPSATDGHNAYADVLIMVIDLVPTATGLMQVVDLDSSTYQSVQLGANGRGTLEYQVPEAVTSGLVLGLALMEHNGLTVGPDPSSIEDHALAFLAGDGALELTTEPAVFAGDALDVGVDGEFPLGTDIVVHLHRKDHAGLFPVLAGNGGEIGPVNGLDVGLLLGEIQGAVEDAVAPVVAQLTESLPARLEGKQSLVLDSFTRGISPMIGAMMSQGGSGGPLAVGTMQTGGAGSGALSTTYTLPANLPAGDYVLIAEAKYDDRLGTPTRVGFADVKVMSSLSSIVDTGIQLSPGWNLVSLPTTSAMDLDAIEAATDGKVIKAMYWDAAEGYQEVSTLQPGRGYWLFAAEDTSIPVTDEGIESFEHQVDGLWRMAGGVARTASLDHAFRSPDALQVQALGWDPIVGDYVSMSMIPAGQGVWLLGNQPGSLTVVAPPAPPQ